MTGVRSYVQELINHAIVSELEFPISWKVFELQFPLLEEKYLANASLLETTLNWRYEVDGNAIIWLLTLKDMQLIANAIARINTYFKKILAGDEVTMNELGLDIALQRAGIALEKSYGKKAGQDSNTIGKWTPIEATTVIDILIGTYQKYRYTTPPPASTERLINVVTHGDLYQFGGVVKVPTHDGAFRDDKPYYELRDSEYVMLELGKDYHLGDIIADFGFPVYEDSILDGILNPAYVDLVTENCPSSEWISKKRGDSEAEVTNWRDHLWLKFGEPTSDNEQSPLMVDMAIRELTPAEQAASGRDEGPVPVSYKVNGVTIPDAYYQYPEAHIVNINELNAAGIALFAYDRNYDWEKDLSQSSITSNLHIRKLIKGWFGHGKSGWSRDINSLPYVQTLDEHEWANAYKKNAQRYINLVRAVRVEDLLGLVNGNPSKFLLLFTIANLYAVRHELLSIYFRALNEIRKKGLYRI